MTASNAAEEAALDKSIQSLQPVDVTMATRVLKEAKQILDQLGVTFFLRQGTCLGAIRDNGFIPWDTDLDLGSVIGLHGFTEKSIDRVIAAFRDNGFIAKVERSDHFIYVPMMKSSILTEWICHWIVDDSIFQYPGVRIPLRLFTDLKEIDFIGEKFHVPNPPEEYLRLKYGAGWVIPKKTGFEKDIVDLIPEGPAPGRAGRLKQFLIKHLLSWRATRIRVLDLEGRPVTGAEVVVIGLGSSRTNSQGYAKFYISCNDYYALVIRFAGHEEMLYEEKMNLGETYLYRPDVRLTSGRYLTLTRESHPQTTAAARSKDSK